MPVCALAIEALCTFMVLSMIRGPFLQSMGHQDISQMRSELQCPPKENRLPEDDEKSTGVVRQYGEQPWYC